MITHFGTLCFLKHGFPDRLSHSATCQTNARGVGWSFAAIQLPYDAIQAPYNVIRYRTTSAIHRHTPPITNCTQCIQCKVTQYVTMQCNVTINSVTCSAIKWTTFNLCIITNIMQSITMQIDRIKNAFSIRLRKLNDKGKDPNKFSVMATKYQSKWSP